MKKLNIVTCIVCILSTYISAGNIITVGSPDHQNATESSQVLVSDTPQTKKRKKSKYKKFIRTFSKYDGSFLEDMFVYSVDMMMPDEIMKATKDVIKNRDDHGFDDMLRHFPKTLSNDMYNVLLSSTYYYMQDISRITDDTWKNAVCSPDSFDYDSKKEPKKVYLDLKESDDNARGVTPKGVVLPFNNNFPNAQYPYASKPDGCSAEELRFIYNISNIFSDDDEWLSQACDEHDKCYSTIGVTYKECNEQFILNAIDSCNNISGRSTLLFMGTKNAFCGIKALSITTGANACAEKYFDKAQRKQKVYNDWVERYEKSYLELMEK